MIKFFSYDSQKNKVIINQPEILLVKEFADLWTDERNKCPEDPDGHLKLKGFKELIYIYIAIDWSAPGSKDTPANRHQGAVEASGLTPEELKELEDFVNNVIQMKLDVTCEEMSLEDAKAAGAHGVFDSKYGEKVKIYTIGDVDKQICGGPHAKNTEDLHHFTIKKEESSSSGIRRIKAILD